jgi:two-component system NtrC family response regulator
MSVTQSLAVETGSILIVDDELKILKLLSRSLVRDGHDVKVTTDALQALRLLSSESFDLLILDNRMPGLSGIDLLRQSRASAAPPACIMMTAYGTVENAVEAMKLGAVDYIQKPFEFETVKEIVRKALARRSEGLRATAARPAPAAAPPREHRRPYGLLGKSPSLEQVLERIESAAPTDSTILIAGETGTGKELVARAIHACSLRRGMPLVKVNCAAIPEGLLESEMFGHLRGAFTGATQDRRGKFALAHQGTLFLDEVSGLSLALQRKLLRVLQEKEFEPLGSERTAKVDVRVIAASNRDLIALAAEGRFQEDLYYRLNVIPIRLPPLRERAEDVPLLAEVFLARFRSRLGRALEGFTPEALEILSRYRWPGNVRELENAVERAATLAKGPLIGAGDIVDLGAGGPPSAATPLALRGNLDRLQRETILRSLKQVSGKKKEAAALLGISQRALSYYLRKFDL